MKYYTCVQCREAKTGVYGTFIATKDKIAISPIFYSLASLYLWMKENGWKHKNDGEPWEVEKEPTK